MLLHSRAYPVTEPGLLVRHEVLNLRTSECLEFHDITGKVAEVVERSGVQEGTINVQSRHTTVAIFVGENEPLLLDDMRDMLERLAPRKAHYQHDDFTIRTVNMMPGEHPNGHAHCKAMFLRAAETLNVVGGRLDLGRWQRLFVVELDLPRDRSISVRVMGI
jgi:secondary thiamine-phosphate synthase enzyme